MSEKQNLLKQNISRLTHTLPDSSNEKIVLRKLGMSALPRKKALNVLLELLNAKNLIAKKELKKQKEQYSNR